MLIISLKICSNKTHSNFLSYNQISSDSYIFFCYILFNISLGVYVAGALDVIKHANLLELKYLVCKAGFKNTSQPFSDLLTKTWVSQQCK